MKCLKRHFLNFESFRVFLFMQAQKKWSHKLKCRSHHIVYLIFGMLLQAILVAMNKLELLISPKIIYRTILYSLISHHCHAITKSTAIGSSIAKKCEENLKKSIYRKKNWEIKRINNNYFLQFTAKNCSVHH